MENIMTKVDIFSGFLGAGKTTLIKKLIEDGAYGKKKLILIKNEEVFDVEHISLAKKADLAIIAPASANVIAKLAGGIADDMLTTTFLACTAPKLIAPAMNSAMYLNPVTQKNISILQNLGYDVIDPAKGLLACGDEGPGKMAEPDVIVEFALKYLAMKKDPFIGCHGIYTGIITYITRNDQKWNRPQDSFSIVHEPTKGYCKYKNLNIQSSASEWDK